MFGLVRFLVSLVMFAAFVWFAVTVPLGKRTLWGHLHAIFSTPEAKDLAEGTKEAAEQVADKVKDELHRTDMAIRSPSPSPSPSAQPAHGHSAPSAAEHPSPSRPRHSHRVKPPLPER